MGCGDQKQMVGQLAGKVGHLETALAEAERQRRQLHNALVEIRGNIRVFCRLKPCSSTAAVAPIHGDGVRATVDGKAHDFFFDRCALHVLGGTYGPLSRSNGVSPYNGHTALECHDGQCDRTLPQLPNVACMQHVWCWCMPQRALMWSHVITRCLCGPEHCHWLMPVIQGCFNH